MNGISAKTALAKWPVVIKGERGSCRADSLVGSPGGSPSRNCAR